MTTRPLASLHTSPSPAAPAHPLGRDALAAILANLVLGPGVGWLSNHEPGVLADPFYMTTLVVAACIAALATGRLRRHAVAHAVALIALSFALQMALWLVWGLAAYEALRRPLGIG